ncbi:MAG: hypothetical protein KIT84_09900 [Labilithrix sp.]|nr:hypothetical protein [Labilithrix sp.]MCW5811315.1 hypothetical protein [Labilithrix sp.]
MTRPLLVALTALAATTTTSLAGATESPAPIAVGEVAADAASADVASLRDTAEGEIRQIDTSKLKRRYVVSFSVARAAAGDAVACTANAILRDAKTGAMIAIIEAGAHAAGTTSDEAAKRVAHAAVRSAMRRIPTALGAK